MKRTLSSSLLVLSLSLLNLMLLPPSRSAAQPRAPDPRFGIVEAFFNPEAASEAGAGYTRIILRWDVIQPTSPADWKPANVPDPIIAGELAAGREVIGLLIGTPAWAQANPDDPADARAVPDMFHWKAFVRGMAQHYRGRIRHWIIWNEPDVWMPDHPGSTWTGTEEDYYQLLKTAYLAIKEVDPALQVQMAGLTYYWDSEYGRPQYLDRLLDIIVADPEAPANDYYFDTVVYHLYFNPLQTVEVLDETRESLARHGIADKEIWINETNAPPSDDPQEPPRYTPRLQVSMEEQAAFIIQQYALAFSAGASRVEVYKLRNTADHPESTEPFGLLRADDSPRPAFTAYQLVTTYLRDFRRAYQEEQGDVLAVTFDRDDQTTTVVWNTSRSPALMQVNAIAAQALLVDERGQTTTLIPVDGRYTVDLPGAACTQETFCFIGGAPRLLVEGAHANDRVALAPSATPAASPSPEPTTTATSIPASTPTATPIVQSDITETHTSPTLQATTATPAPLAQEPGNGLGVLAVALGVIALISTLGIAWLRR